MRVRNFVDEYETEQGGQFQFALPVEHSERPLTLAELIDAIDGAQPSSSDFVHSDERLNAGPVWGNVAATYFEGEGDPDQAAAFAHVSSTVYPELERYYELRLEAWRTAAQAEIDLDDE